MGRPSGRVRAFKALSTARVNPARDPLQDPKVLELTARFLEIRVEHFRESVDAAIELGEILREGAPRVTGHYGEWLNILVVSPAAANNYVHLAVLAEEHPGIIQRWKELGATKLYRISRMTPRGRQIVLVAAEKPRLMDINDQRFQDETAPYIPGPGRTVTADMRAHGFRMKVKSWTDATGEARVSGVKKPELRAGLRKDILALCKALHEIADALKT